MLSSFLAVIRKGLRSILRFRGKAVRGQSHGGGRRDDPDDGSVFASVTVPIKPPPPVLVGKDAKKIPTRDNDGDESELAA